MLYYIMDGKRKANDLNPNISLVDIGSDCAIAFEDNTTKEVHSTKESKGKKGKGRCI